MPTGGSPWARDKTERFKGRGSMYRLEQPQSAPNKLPKACKPNKPPEKTQTHRMPKPVRHHKPLPQASPAAEIKLPNKAPAPVCPTATDLLANECDTLNLVLGHLPPLVVASVASVSHTWYAACEIVRASEHGLAMHPDVLRPLLARAPDLVMLASCSAVCSTWRAAARAERNIWRVSVKDAIEQSRSMPRPYPLLLPFVEGVVRISNRCGIDIATCGGLANSLRFALRALGLLHVLNSEERVALIRSGPQLSVVSRPANEGAPPPPPDEDNTFVIVGVERIASHHVKVLADAMAAGLLLISPVEWEGGMRVEEEDGEARSLAEVLDDHLP